MNALENGDYETSIENLIELNTFDEKNNITYNTFWYYMVIAEAYILLNQKERAKEYFDMAKNAMDPDVEYQKLEYDLHLALLKKNEKPDTQVEKVLLSSLKYYDSLNLIYSKSQAAFYLADFYYKTGKLQTALKYLKDSLDITSEKGFHSFITQDFISKRYLFDLAAANKIHVDYIQSIYSRLLERENYTWLSDDFRRRWEKESISLYDIKLVTFGGIEIYVRGIPASEDKWIRKKSKLLLVYLLINREQKHTKDKIMNLFFGDLSPTSAENIFHQAITNIRNVVKPYSEAPDEQLSFKGKKTKYEKPPVIASSESFIQYEDKILRIAPGYNYFVDVNEFMKLSNLVKSPGTNITEKENYAKRAVKLYQGEFLPGYYDDWVEELRMSLQNRFIGLCEELLAILRENLKFDEIILYAEKLITEDKLHEEAYISLIEAYQKTGNIDMAKKKFSRLLKNYEEEYGEKPDKKVLSRIENILL
jgi:DNA-binding SARP family transcriptional activator